MDIRSCLVGCLLVLGANRSIAQITGSFEANLDGTFTYHYNVDNSGGSFVIFAWSLGLTEIDWIPFDPLLGGDVTVPDNWAALPGTPIGTPFAQDFLSLDSTTDVAIGDVLGGFEFTSGIAPGSVQFTAFGDNASASGVVIGPAVVPESAATGLWVGVGAMAFAAWTGRRVLPISCRERTAGSKRV